MRLITFSRKYPGYHPKAGEPTYFIEKIWNSISWDKGIPEQQFPIPYHLGVDFRSTDEKKHHTIRTGHHWKAGDWFKPVVWGNDINPKSGRSGPYHSKPVQFAPEIQIVKTWDFDMDKLGVCSIAKPGEQLTYTFCYSEELDDIIAKNDGLTSEDFYWWFSRSPEFKKKGGFNGQIICWNESIEYRL